MKNIKIKNKYIIIMILTLIISVFTLSFAYFQGNVINDLVYKTDVSTGNINIKISDVSVEVVNMQPLYTRGDSYEDAAFVKHFSVYNDENTLNTCVTLYLKINNIAAELANKSFKYVVENDETGVSFSGDFNGASNNSDLYLGTLYFFKKGETKNYTMYIWIEYDADINQINMLNKKLNASLYVKAQDSKEGDECKNPLPYLYNVLKQDAKNNALVKLYTGKHNDSYNEIGNRKIYHYNATTTDEVNQILNKNNVLFGGFCWQIIRTTDTGGVRLLYNGIPTTSNGNISCSNDNSIQSIGQSKFNDGYDSPGYIGYMYNKTETEKYASIYKKMTYYKDGDTSGDMMYFTFKYSSGFEYKNGVYSLKNNIKEIEKISPYDLENRHYTCLSYSETCENGEIYYITGFSYDGDDYHIYYVTLKDGNSIESALNSMLYDNVNQDDSIMKIYIENWFENNLVDYINYLEDSVYCNDRSVIDYSNWGSNNNCAFYGQGKDFLKFKNYNLSSDLYCENITDRFSVNNSNAKLKYPVALITHPELNLLMNNGKNSADNSFLTLSPERFSQGGEIVNGSLYGINNFQAPTGYWINYGKSPGTVSNVRPAITLNSEIRYSNGDGSASNPYIIYTE